ncbi:WD repeatcontaining protein [Acanthamoeba castellanii str. Neff]|uniref:WD repeatcontaining protein n=1 Tax=Acanthamoeba castellanii (strain ATCC 30010 / Neff) TaxID=1257118 RepID=L8H5P4_ACACF|nr:WD repeatcontaining protein [Acanthamoeba castellanii str. Neff]ELR19786.1 WD repeatcontaining protein [Acanthamoeba castellanii str. Neff]
MATTLELVDLPGSEGQDTDCIDEPQLRERTAAQPLHKAHRDAVRALKMSPDRRLLASASNDHTVRVWDAETLECLHTLTGHTDSVRVLAFAAHNSDTTSSATILLSAGRDHTVKIWDADKGQLLHSLRHTMASGNTCMAHAIEANDTTAAVGYADGSIALVCLETGQVVQMLSGHTHWITSLHMRPGLLVSGSCDRKVIDWDLRTGQPAHVFVGHTSDVNAVLAFGPENERIGSCIQTLAKRSETGHVVGSRSRPVNEVISMQTKHYATRPEVTTLISGNTGKVSSGVRLWGLDALGERAASLHSEATEGVRGILSLAVSARYLVATTWDCKVLVCDFGRSGQSIRWVEEQDNAEASLMSMTSQAYVPPWQRRQQQAEPDCAEEDYSGPDDYTREEED